MVDNKCIIVVFFLIKTLPSETYGQIVVFKTLFLIISSIGGIGVSQSVVHLENKGSSPFGLLNVATTTVLCLSAFCSTIMCILFLFFFAQELSISPPLFCTLVFCLFGLFQANNEIINYKRARRLTSSYLKGALFRGGATLILVISFTYIKPDLIGFIFGQIVAEALFFAVYLSLEKIRFVLDSQLSLSLLRFGWPHALTISSGFAMNYVDRHIILMRTGQLELVAYYDAVSLLAMSAISVLSRPYNLFLLPSITNRYFASGKLEADKFLQKTQLLFVFFALAFASTIHLNLEWLISFLFTEEYQLAGPIFPYITFCIVMNSLVMSCMPQFNVVGKTQYLGYLAIVSVIVNVGFAVFLVPIYGLLGAAFGIAAASFLQFFVALLLVKYLLKSSVSLILILFPIIWLCLVVQIS